VSQNLERLRTYPRLVGETGGKGFIFAHASAEPAAVATAIVRGAFEYQGQKCSAASRAYIPESLWPGVRGRLAKMVEQARVGDVRDFRSFMGAVIDRPAFERITRYIEEARASREAEVVIGGEADDAKGFFIRPTVIRTSDPKSRGMTEEIFGPVLTVYVYEDRMFEETLALVDGTSPYALTGSVFGRDRGSIRQALDRLSQAAGNVYINDKPTGAVVGQQPFGGGRLSGTNDKAGGYFNMLRWTSPQAVKENFLPPKDPFYPHMSEE
jgi:1-pyrroline-5-carboxylate dehydrogenase